MAPPPPPDSPHPCVVEAVTDTTMMVACVKICCSWSLFLTPLQVVGQLARRQHVVQRRHHQRVQLGEPPAVQVLTILVDYACRGEGEGEGRTSPENGGLVRCLMNYLNNE